MTTSHMNKTSLAVPTWFPSRLLGLLLFCDPLLDGLLAGVDDVGVLAQQPLEARTLATHARLVAGQGRAGQGRAGQGRAGQGRAGQGRAGQGRAGQGRAGHVTASYLDTVSQQHGEASKATIRGDSAKMGVELSGGCCVIAQELDTSARMSVCISTARV